LWYEYVSLLINVILLVGIFSILVSLIEIYNFSKLRTDWEYNSKIPNKAIGILFLGVFLTNIIVMGAIFAQRQPVPHGSDSPTFMTWNIHNGIGIDDSFDLDRLVQQIDKEEPDVLGLNEVDMGALKTSFVDIGSYFAHHLNMYYYYGYTFYKHYGNILLSKYPILNAKIIELPLAVESAEPRSMIKATLEINSSQWTVYLTHLSTEQKDREAQVPFIVNKTNENSFENVIWMGDFNFQPNSDEYNLINNTSSLNFTDTYRSLNSDDGYTYIEDGSPQRRIDYIMCSPDLTPTQSKVICTVGSDHCAVITTF
jgi:endonuclease/exonuclease/phosphatase family metal-dependent hydrolase